MTKLYEVDHPYYMTEGCYYNSKNHQDFDSFDDFLEEWGDANQDLNWVIRWDWEEDKLKIQYFMQRKAYPFSCFIKINKSDHNRVVKFLKPFADYMKTMWEPLIK